MSRKRIICPFHQESTPSCILYEKSFKCFACGAYGPLEALGIAVDKDTLVDTKPVEDVSASVEYIESLPKEFIRGLNLHADKSNYYILWPNAKYYKSRSKAIDDGGKKYKCPYGVSKPPFMIRSATKFSWYKRSLVIVEGELNALSLSEAFPYVDIMSPGGAGDFTSSATKKLLPQLQEYNRILIIADNDPAGAEAAIGLTGFLRSSGIKTKAKLMDRDANEVLTSEGRPALEKIIRSYLAELSEK